MKDKNAENIMEWRKAILKLPDQKFFDLMTFYLGEIKTPFNKQNLIDDLSAFLRKESVQEKIFLRISISETYLIACILLLQKATFEFLRKFFKNDCNQYQLQELLANLEQRLIIFTQEKNGENVYTVNPYLLRKFEPLAKLETFLVPTCSAPQNASANLLNSINILSAYSFFLHNVNCVKLNGELRKKVFERVENIFILYRDNLLAFNYLLRAFLNLSLFTNSDKGLQENANAWKKFYQLSLFEMQCYIVVAASGNYCEKYLNLLAKTFAEFFTHLDTTRLYETADLEKAFSLLQENLNTAFVDTEIHNEDNNEHEVFFNSNENKRTIIEAAKMFGLFTGDENHLTANPNLNEHDTHKTILVSPSFEVTVFPSNDFASLLPLAAALNPSSVQTTAVFELSRKTCGLFFESKGNDETLRKIFLENITGNLPQNIDISLQHWYQNFSAVKLYSGVVAVIAKEKCALFENQMPLHNLVEKKLTDNVFVLRSVNIDDIKEMLESAGLECLVEKSQKGFNPVIPCNLKSFSDIESTLQILNFDTENLTKKIILKNDFLKQKNEMLKIVDKEKKELFAKVESLCFEKSEKDFLHEQIRRNIIFDETQITAKNIKFDAVQVSVLDYTAKVRLCESAVLQNKKLEITVDSHGAHRTFYCTPVEVKKSPEKDILKLIMQHDEKAKSLDISKIAKIKIVKDAIF